ncbi:histamine H4 receptor-like [Lytechinus variegatus]|uniref:histamine H4 receptor-like n=1 Tax=Lytechinus variegatus TaxID=7654 RepID=UPI001BB23251|nr:histamine H4 receptor-like [Lytechinus variegatus]
MDTGTSTFAGSLPGPEAYGTELTALRVVLVCLFIPSTVLIILGNAYVLAAYKRDERIRKRRTNTFILNLAIADLLVGITMIIYIPQFITDKWLFGRKFCIIVWAISYISTDMSVITVIAISVDRYLMVRNAMKYQIHQSRRRIILIFIVVWFFCSLVHNSLAFIYSAWTEHKYLEYQTCNLEYRREKTLVISMFIIEFVLPVLTLFLLNLKVFIRIQKRKETGIQLKGRRGEDPNSKVVSGRDSKNDREKTSGLPIMRVHRTPTPGGGHQKAAKLLTILLLVFILCWLPYYINECYVLIHGGETNNVATEAMTFILWANSAINPILYAYANVHYRENFLYFLHIGKKRSDVKQRLINVHV